MLKGNNTNYVYNVYITRYKYELDFNKDKSKVGLISQRVIRLLDESH